MQEQQQLLQSFAAITRLESSLLRSTQSVFPVLQNAATRKMKVLPQELAFFNSAIPFVCALGRPMHPAMSNVDATNILIALNTVHLIFHECMSHDFRKLSESEIDDLFAMTKACRQVLDVFRRDPLTVKKAHLVVLLEEIDDFMGVLSSKQVDEESFNKLLKRMVYDAKKCTLYLKGMFKHLFDNTAQEPLTPLLLQFFLDLQPYGLFECLANRYQDFTFNESMPIEGARAVFLGDKDNAHSIFSEVASQFEKESETRASGHLCGFCAAAARACGASARELANAIEKSVFIFHFQKFGVPETATVPFEFSQAIIRLLENFEKGRGDHSVTVKLAESLRSYTVDVLIQYLCDAAGYYQQYEVGYLGLIGAFLPVANHEKLKHHEPLLKIIISLYMQNEQQMRAVISEKNPMLSSEVENELRNLGQVTDLPSAIKAYVVLQAVYAAMVGAGVADERMEVIVSNLGRLLISWIICLAAILKAVVITFVPNAISTIEKNKSITQEQLDRIQHAFDSIAVLDLTVATSHVVSNLLNHVSDCMYGILPLVEDLIETKPLSLENTEKEFRDLLRFCQVALKYFHLVEGAIVTFNFNPAFKKQQVLSLIQSVNGQIEPIPQYVTSEPEQLQSLLMQTRTVVAPYLWALTAIDPSVNIKDLTADIRNMTDSREAPVIVANHDAIRQLLQTHEAATAAAL